MRTSCVVPHYTPMTRGVLSTCYARAKAGSSVTTQEVRMIFHDFYGAAPFVRVSDAPPSTKHVMGTNYCLVYPMVKPETGTIVVASALDNLGKGAAGAMVQCFNVMNGLPETMGLQQMALFP